MARPLAAFVLTLGVTAPALLDANIELDGKKLRPREQTFQIDGTRVTVDVDRALAMTGDKVTATIVAYSDTPKQVQLDLRLVQTHLQLGERIEPPAHQIDREKLTVLAKPDGGKTSVALVLGTPRKSLGQLDRFSIYVGQHGTPSPVNKPNYDGGGDSGDDFWQASIEAGKAASVDIMGWSGNSISMKTTVEGKIVAGEPFIIDVHVKNTTGAVLPDKPNIQVSTGATLATAGDDDEIQIDALDVDRDEPQPIKRGAETVSRFRIAPKHAEKQITLAISADAFNTGIGPMLGGARDVITFHAADADAKVALK